MIFHGRQIEGKANKHACVNQYAIFNGPKTASIFNGQWAKNRVVCHWWIECLPAKIKFHHESRHQGELVGSSAVVF